MLDRIPVTIGDIQLAVPAAAAARGILEMVLPDQAVAGGALDAPDLRTFADGAEVRKAIGALPAIGDTWNGGKYAGPSLHDNQPVALVLLPGDEDGLTWDKAVKWADKRGGVLPSRIDQLVLFQNLKAEFKPECYWSGETPASDSASAWNQYFDDGDQLFWHKGGKYRAVAVRRYPI